MTESTELHSYSFKVDNQDDIQEYHEIIEETKFHKLNPCVRKNVKKSISEYDFFTNINVNPTEKKRKKSKKSKKKENTESLMDMVNSEIAAANPPTTENIITIEDYTVDQRIALLKNYNTFPLIIQKRQIELRHKSQSIKLSPIFPRVLENAARQNVNPPVEYVEPTMYNYLIENYKEERTNDITFLDITFKNLKFNCHHMYSLEQLLSIKLRELYNEYENINKTLNCLSREIKVSRETKNNLKDDLIKIIPNKENSVRIDPVVRKYTAKFLQFKDGYMKALKRRREIMHNIESVWSDIEMVREKSKYTLTTCILYKNEQQISEVELEKRWTDLYNTEYADALDKIEDDYISKYVEYKDAKNQQKLETSSKKQISKPQLTIDETTLNEEVQNIVDDIITNDSFEFILKEDETIKSALHKRDNILLKSIFCFEIYVDDIFVCESEQYMTDKENFEVDFIETFSIQILPNNNNVTIALIENDEKVSKVKFDLLEIKKRRCNANFTKVKFCYDITVKPTSKHVGSGNTIKEIALANKVRLKSCSIFENTLHTESEIFIQMKWNIKQGENYIETIKSSVEIGRHIKKLMHGIEKPTFELLQDLISNLFEKDVTLDADTVNAITDLCKTEIKFDNTFHIDINSPEFIRLKLLYVRNKGGFVNLEDKIIPLQITEITSEQLNCLEQSNNIDFDLDYLHDNELEMDPIEIQRFIGSKYIEKLNQNMLKNLNDVLLKKTYKDVVRDFTNLSLRGCFTRPNNLTLGALSNVTKQKMLKESLGKPQEVQVTVLKAYNLLDRNTTLEDANNSDRIAGFKMRPLRPFVRVNYHGISVQTTTAIGCHPTWNHTLKINTKLEPLSSIHINIYDEYKENISEGYSDDEHSNKMVQYRYYNRWLGTLEIPLYHVLALGILRGTFKITAPPLILGYEISQTKTNTSFIPEVNQMLKKDISFIALQITTNLSHLGRLQQYNLPVNAFDDDLIRHLNNFTIQYTNDFPFRSISLTFIDSAGGNKCVTEFLQPLPIPNQIVSLKNPKSCESADSKSSRISRTASERSRTGKEIDIERGPIEDRSYIYNAFRNADRISKMIDACMRYVALIPSYEVTESHAVTLMGVELLKILHGSPLDHTILLASYFLQLDIKCWVVTGLGLPRGPSSYVLTKYNLATRRMVQVHDQPNNSFFSRNDGYLWYVFDSLSGEKFELRDVGCPLKTVDYVFDNENIWVNVQSSQECDCISFDFSRSSDWQQVFKKPVFIPKPVPTASSLYSNPRNVEPLRKILETKIKAKVQKWRSRVKTIWNRYCGTLLKESLPQWEYWAFDPTEQKPELNQRLKQFMVSHKIFGFPLNMPFTNTKAVISRIKSTGIHHNDDPAVELALGVELYSYPNNVISVWVYLATVTKIL